MSLLTNPTTSRRSLLMAWIPTIAWGLVIACESTGTFTGARTMIWTHRLLSLFSDHVSLSIVELVNHALRKTGHFFGYAALSWLAFRGWMETMTYKHERFLLKLGRPIGPRRWHLRAAVLAVLCTIAIASLDEFHQTYLPGRTGVFRDVVLDTMGGVFAQTLLLLYWTNRKLVKTPAESASKQEVLSAQ
jgi:VanZ family protein